MANAEVQLYTKDVKELTQQQTKLESVTGQGGFQPRSKYFLYIQIYPVTIQNTFEPKLNVLCKFHGYLVK